MSTHKRSGFFDILKTYAPNYEPKKHDEKEKKTKPVSESEKENHKKNESEQNPVNKKKDQPHKEQQRKKAIDHSKSFDREKTQDLERQRREKNIQSYDKWQLVKQTVKEEETDRLKEKIYLQLQLIKYQELAYQQKVQEREEEKVKERERQKALKRALAQDLLEQCKQSLAEDRQKKNQQKTRNRTKSNATTTVAFNTPHDLAPTDKVGEDHAQENITSTSDSPTKVNSPEKKREEQKQSPSNPDDPPSRLPTKVLLDDSEDEKDLPTVSPSVYEKQRREGTDISSVASLSNTPTPGKQSPITREITTNITREMTRASTLPEEDEDFEEEQEEEVDEFAEYPWYQQQLYRLYGRKEADFFLHPKVEAKAKKKAKTIDPKFKNPDGRTGANELWSNLRRESQGKILRVDASIPEELKD